MKKANELFRSVEVTYIFGNTGTGKTRYVLEKHGYRNVCRVTNYETLFKNYRGEDVIMLDDFRSSVNLKDMMNILDGYPLILPGSNKAAAYTKVYIVSGVPLENQYLHLQSELPTVWQAFNRRIHNVYDFNIPIKIIK